MAKTSQLVNKSQADRISERLTVREMFKMFPVKASRLANTTGFHRNV